jgi:hypothetical protein
MWKVVLLTVILFLGVTGCSQNNKFTGNPVQTLPFIQDK